jgi:hypothetical protein
MTKSLGQAYSIQTFDQQLYAIVKQVEWAKQDTFKSHSEDKASYTNGNARTALLNCLPVIICSTDPTAYTKIQSTDLSIHYHPKVYQLTQ